MTEKDFSTASSINSSQLNFNFDTMTSPLKRSKPCTTSLQSACRLSLTTHRVYSQEMDLPEGVEAISVRPAAGMLLNKIYTRGTIRIIIYLSWCT